MQHAVGTVAAVAVTAVTAAVVRVEQDKSRHVQNDRITRYTYIYVTLYTDMAIAVEGRVDQTRLLPYAVTLVKLPGLRDLVDVQVKQFSPGHQQQQRQTNRAAAPADVVHQQHLQQWYLCG